MDDFFCFDYAKSNVKSSLAGGLCSGPIGPDHKPEGVFDGCVIKGSLRPALRSPGEARRAGAAALDDLE